MALTTEELLKLMPGFDQQVKQARQREDANAAWKQERRGLLTASEVHKLFTSTLEPAKGNMAKGYIYDVCAESFGAYPDEWSSRQTAWGKQYEPVAVEKYIAKTGHNVYSHGENQKFLRWGKRCGATPDGLISPDGCLQVKCPFRPGIHFKHLLFTDQDYIRLNVHDYYIQMQMEILVTGSLWCHFVSYDPRFPVGKDLHIVKVEKDLKFQEMLVATLENAEREVERLTGLVSSMFMGL